VPARFSAKAKQPEKGKVLGASEVRAAMKPQRFEGRTKGGARGICGEGKEIEYRLGLAIG